jgi:excisionase family DNA binding protein
MSATLGNLAKLIAQELAEELRPLLQAGGGKRCLKALEAAEYLGITVAALRHLTATADLKAVRNGRAVLYDVRDLDAWIVRKKVA